MSHYKNSRRLVALPLPMRWHGSPPLFKDGIWTLQWEKNPETLPVATVDRGDDTDQPTRTEGGEIAQRLVNCWNACTGMYAANVEELANRPDAVRSLVAGAARVVLELDEARAQLAEVTAERDALRAMLADVLECDALCRDMEDPRNVMLLIQAQKMVNGAPAGSGCEG